MRARLPNRRPMQAVRAPVPVRSLRRAMRAAGAGRRLLARVVLALALLAGLAAGTAWAAAAPEIRVLLVESSSPVEIRSASAVHRVGLARRGAELVVDGRSAGSTWTAQDAGPWQVAGRRYRGRIVVHADPGQLSVVNHVELEDYVAATVGGEMPASWPAQALCAQAVATRTYALHQRALHQRAVHQRARQQPATDWDVRATEQSQVYRGIESETQRTLRAADATRGEVLTLAGQPILAVFHSTSGGRTASASEVWGKSVPYLGSIDVEYEDVAPFTYWRTVFPPATLSGLLASVGSDLGRVDSLEVTGRTESGRVERIVATEASRREVWSGDRLRSLVEGLGLRSRLFDIRPTPQGFAFVGSGYGHGVGMSQWGARELARRGTSYQRILARFYPGAELSQWRAERVASRADHGKRGN